MKDKLYLQYGDETPIGEFALSSRFPLDEVDVTKEGAVLQVTRRVTYTFVDVKGITEEDVAYLNDGVKNFVIGIKEAWEELCDLEEKIKREEKDGNN